MDRRDEETARADAKMRLDAVAPGDREGKLMELAKRNDSVGALVTSSWGRDYLATTSADERTIDRLTTRPAPRHSWPPRSRAIPTAGTPRSTPGGSAHRT